MSEPWDALMVRLHRERGGRLLAFATMLAGSSMAEDLVQESVIAVFSRHRSFDSLPVAEAYVRRTIATRYIDHVRADSSRRRLERLSAVPDATTDSAAHTHAQLDLQRALETLPPRHRACVVLRYLDDLSIRDTATTMNISEGAVKRYVHDGLHALNTALGTSWDDIETTTVHPTQPKGEPR